jgi:hypothetical protein
MPFKKVAEGAVVRHSRLKAFPVNPHFKTTRVNVNGKDITTGEPYREQTPDELQEILDDMNQWQDNARRGMAIGIAISAVFWILIAIIISL